MTSPFRCPVSRISPTLFRAYDIRGIVDQDLTAELVHDIGLVLGSLIQETGESSVVVGRDGRLSGPLLSDSLQEGLQTSGCQVIDIGCVPTPLMYFATHQLGTTSGIVITGSHNPPEYNGIKMVIRHKSVSDEQIQTIYQRLLKQQSIIGKGHRIACTPIPDYIRYITQTVRVSRKLKVVVDAGNGVTGLIAPKLYEALGCEVIPLFCDVDGHFPHHHPDPSQPHNLEDLISAVKNHQADVGLAFDGDGDRLGVVSNRGQILSADRQLMLYARSVLKQHPGRTVLYDVKCSKNLAPVIEAAGGIPCMVRTGHSFIKAKLHETKAILAGELSGHICFNDRWFGFDDGLYTGARLLEILSQHSEDSDTWFNQIPNSLTTPEFSISVPDVEKFTLLSTLIDQADFPECRLITLDGLRVEGKDAWGLIRASNTTPSWVLRFEADNPRALEKIKDQFKKLILTAAPHLKIPF